MSLIALDFVSTFALSEGQPPISVIHYGDPWCWYSWGLEPVIQRLHEVYDDQIELVYKMGGVFQNLDEWRSKYGVSVEEALASWIADSDKMMRNPPSGLRNRPPAVGGLHRRCFGRRRLP
jgi:hypothetical protein